MCCAMMPRLFKCEHVCLKYRLLNFVSIFGEHPVVFFSSCLLALYDESQAFVTGLIVRNCVIDASANHCASQ